MRLCPRVGIGFLHGELKRREQQVLLVSRPFSSSSNSKDKQRERLKKYSQKSTTPVTLQQMLALNNAKQRCQIAPHLRNELLVRLARRYSDMRDLPKQLFERNSVQSVVKLYYDFFQELAAMDSPDTEEKDAVFTQALHNFYIADSATLPLIARSMREWKRDGLNLSVQETSMLDARLDDLFTARLSVRMLIGQHCEMVSGRSKIKRGLCVADTAKLAASTATNMCLKRFGVCPEVQILGDQDFKFTYVQSHLHHMLFELLKNSVRAVVEQHQGEIGEERRKRLKLSSEGHLINGLPPVVVIVSGGAEDVVIKVSDEGGGIPRSEINKIWSYTYTTATQTDYLDVDSQDPAGASFITNFYGGGYGLPISRVFARYFGGDLNVISTEGWGTDAYIYINRLESSAVETLPD